MGYSNVCNGKVELRADAVGPDIGLVSALDHTEGFMD